MKQTFFRSLAATAAVVAVSGFATLAQAGTTVPERFQENVGATLSGLPSVTEEQTIFGPEYTIVNPLNSAFGPVRALMVAIEDQALEAATANERWSADTFLSFADIDNFLSFVLTVSLDSSVLFDDFAFAGDGDVVLVFSVQGPLADVQDFFVAPGFSLGGFFGFDGIVASNVALLGVNGQVCTGNTAGACTNPNASNTAVPEPGTLALFGIGVIGIGAAIRRRRRLAA